MYVCVHVRTLILVLAEAHVQWNNELEQVLLLMFSIVNIMGRCSDWAYGNY